MIGLAMKAGGRLRQVLVAVVAVVLALSPQTMSALAAGPTGNVVISGDVKNANATAGVTGAQVYAVHLDTKQVFKSATTAGDGKYQITGLPFGYYDIAVLTPSGLYLANRVINAPAGEKVEVSLALGQPQPEDTEWWSAEPDRRIPGLDRIPDGVARIIESRPPKGAQIASQPKAVKAAPKVAAAAGTLPRWLVPVLGGLGILALGAFAKHDNDQKDKDASRFQ